MNACCTIHPQFLTTQDSRAKASLVQNYITVAVAVKRAKEQIKITSRGNLFFCARKVEDRLKNPELQQKKCACTPLGGMQTGSENRAITLNKKRTRISLLFKQIGSGSTQQGRKTNIQTNEAVPLKHKSSRCLFWTGSVAFREKEVYDMFDLPLTPLTKV